MTSARTRDRLVQRLMDQGIRSEAVLNQIRNVPRHLFVDEALASRAYEDTALPIGLGQTISQPFIVARMTEALLAGFEGEKVLEIGTGSGFLTALLALCADRVYSVERVRELSVRARKALDVYVVRLRAARSNRPRSGCWAESLGGSAGCGSKTGSQGEECVRDRM